MLAYDINSCWKNHLTSLFNLFDYIFNSEMESLKQSLNQTSKDEARRQRLSNKATWASKKSSCLQKKIQIEVAKRSSDMTKINKWKKNLPSMSTRDFATWTRSKRWTNITRPKKLLLSWKRYVLCEQISS